MKQKVSECIELLEYEIDIRIGHSGDAINLIDELLSGESKRLPISDYCKQVERGLAALKDALMRGII
jgi:hypothetical protein